MPRRRHKERLEPAESEKEEREYANDGRVESRSHKRTRSSSNAKDDEKESHGRKQTKSSSNAVHDGEDEDYGGRNHRHKKNMYVKDFFDVEAIVDKDEDEDEDYDDAEDGFIDGVEIPDKDDPGMHYRSVQDKGHDIDVDALERTLHERYSQTDIEYDKETTDVEQQALLPSVTDPKLWMVKCAIGHEREVVACLMQKCMDKGSQLQIRSAIALDHLKNYIYIEADKEAHVLEACKSMRSIFTGTKIVLVPIKEMSDVLSVKSKAVEISRGTWVRLKNGIYKGDLGKIMEVNNVGRKVTVKLIPRVDLQALANKLEGREVPKKKAFTPPQRFMNVDEARALNIRVDRRRNSRTGGYFENIDGMHFKDGFLYKIVSMKSISTQSIQPSFNELEKFQQPSENGNEDEEEDGEVSLSTLFANRKKGYFMKGDRVIIIKGDLINLKGSVEKVEEDIIHINPYDAGLPKTFAVSEKELCKYFEPGNHVKVVSGASEGVTGMVATVEKHLLSIVCDTTKETIQVFSDLVVESSEVTSGKTRLGDYEFHDLVLLQNLSFGVIIRVESEVFRVLKGVPDRPEVALVRLGDIKYKIEKKISAQDSLKNVISVQDVVRVLEGPCKGKQGPVEHIYKGMLFVYDRHHLEHGGFLCAKSQSCMVVGGSRGNGDRNGDLASQFGQLKTASRVYPSPGRIPRGDPPIPCLNSSAGGRFSRGGRGHNSLIGTSVRVCVGPYKGLRGIVKDVKGPSVRVELESQMKTITVSRDQISDNVNTSTPFSETPRYGAGSEIPLPSRTPLRPIMTPMRDSGAATPIHDGMRTPMRDRAWNPYAPMSPPGDNREEGNPAYWATSPRYEPGSPSPMYEAGTPRNSCPAYGLGDENDNWFG